MQHANKRAYATLGAIACSTKGPCRETNVWTIPGTLAGTSNARAGLSDEEKTQEDEETQVKEKKKERESWKEKIVTR